MDIRISVRQLVEFLLRTGSIDSRMTGFDRALEGARIHRQLQKAAGEGYAAEVALQHTYAYEELRYTIEGRADGIFADEDGLMTIDEIKTTTLPAEQITEDHEPVHWAQGMVYAAIYALQNDLPRMAVRLTYYQVDDELTLRFTRVFTREELDAFVWQLMEGYAPWARRTRDWQADRTVSLAQLRFPFEEYRTGQRALAGEVYRACRDGSSLLAQAPTGIGKTVSALFPGLKAMGEEKLERIFYLTARTTTRQSADDALALLHRKNTGLALRSIQLTAKDKLCPRVAEGHRRECTSEACPYANGYYDKVKDALDAGLSGPAQLGPDALLTLGAQYAVCPFELGLDLSLWCDVIVGDYNYLFDPSASLQRFFTTGGDYLFLVDEAHNLPDRARGMYSAELAKNTLTEAKKLLPKGKNRLRTALNKACKGFSDWKDPCRESEKSTVFSAEIPENLLKPLTGLTAPLKAWLEEHREGADHDALLEVYFQLRTFLRVAESYDSHYVTRLTCFGSDLRAQLLCLDPSPFLQEKFGLGRASVLFSATLTPPGYYKDLCGLPQAKAISLPSPFPTQRLGLYCAADVSTRYADRAASLPAISRYLHTMVQARTGNYLAFFPSYAYLRQSYEHFCAQYPDVPTLVQESGMDDAARADFLARFSSSPDGTLLGFAVLGGAFGEGVDLTGDRLIGVAVVGVGLPQVNPVQEKLREYFNDTRGSGFDYAYRYPGMNKVLQAVGRVIRTGSDKGVALLIDDRFSSPSYRRLLPPHWQHCLFLQGPDRLAAQLDSFWQETDGDSGSVSAPV